RTACGIDYPIGRSVSTPATIGAAATATKTAETDPDADADPRRRRIIHARRRIIVHHARRRTANDHDIVVIWPRPAWLAIDPLLRRIRLDAPDRGVDLQRLRLRRRRLQ